MTTFTILHVEAAIRYYLAKEPSRNCQLISVPARQLADIYGLMIWNKQAVIDAALLTVDQLQALNKVPASIKAEAL